MLRKKAEGMLDKRLAEAVGELRRAIGSVWEGQDYNDAISARSMVLNLFLQEPYERANFVALMEEEARHGKCRTKAIDAIHRHLASAFLKKLDKLGEDVEELRNEVEWHDHN
jgi:predicted translin family RNA/ssDNA-binding protein